MLLTVAQLITRRLLAAVPILLIVSFLLFCVLRLLPVDPAAMSLPPTATIVEIEAKRREMGLDRPLPEQYLIWLKAALHGDFGRSIVFGRGAGSLVANTLPATIELAVSAMAIAAVLGIGGGLLLFHLRGSFLESVADLASILLLSIPEFLWGLILLFVFGVVLRVLPFTGAVSPGLPQPHITGFLLLDSLLIGRLRYFCQRLPASDPAGLRARSRLFAGHHARPALEPVRCLSRGLHRAGAAARAFGAADPARPCAEERRATDLTLAGVQFGILFSGTLLVEVIYSYPGMGNLMIDAVRNADLPLIQAIGLTYCVVVLLINTMVDSLYVVLNPKLRVH